MKKLIYLLLFMSISFAHAQGDRESLRSFMTGGDSVDINNIATYPDNVRQLVFDAATQPQAVARMGDLQKKFNGKFRELLAPYPKDQQQKIWNLTRYDKLIAQLAKTKAKKKKMEAVLKDFPAEVHDNALAYALDHHDLIVSIDKLNNEYDNEFIAAMATYSAEVQPSFRKLQSYPELLNILH
jgi:hypothetical protein